MKGELFVVAAQAVRGEAERAGLRERAERLQRANKQRRTEMDQMQVRLSAVHQRAAAYDQVSLLIFAT